MILIYTHTESPRLRYICAFIFKEQLGIEFDITTEREKILIFPGPKINYSNEVIAGSFKIESTSLLFEKSITHQSPTCFQANGYKAFYKIQHADFPFDIFAATFFLLSRYEEYLSFQKDMYGRYGHENSLAFKEGFLDQPLINTWLKDFSTSLKKFFPALTYNFSTFSFLPTYDVDIAWSYKNKGITRNTGGFIKAPSLERIKVLGGLSTDPFDSYEFLHGLHRQYKLQPVYFFLVATDGSKYDKNISPANLNMQHLIQEHAEKYEIGLHPSWKSNEEETLLSNEKNMLEFLTDKKPVTRSRQHYIKFTLPGTYEILIRNGITHDYSMGYGSINGFRASVASSFFWYDLAEEKQTSLRIHPFCFMDANSFYEQHLNVKEAYHELIHYYNVCRAVNGVMITIFHNNFLGYDKKFNGWKEMYEKFISEISNIRSQAQ